MPIVACGMESNWTVQPAIAMGPWRTPRQRKRCNISKQNPSMQLSVFGALTCALWTHHLHIFNAQVFVLFESTMPNWFIGLSHKTRGGKTCLLQRSSILLDLLQYRNLKFLYRDCFGVPKEATYYLSFETTKIISISCMMQGRSGPKYQWSTDKQTAPDS